MSEPMPLTRIGMPERRMLPVVTVGPYVLLAILTVATVAIKHSAVGSLRIDLTLCGLAAAWIAWMFTLHPAWRVRPRPMAVFFVVFVVIMAILVIRDPWFGFLTPAGYFYAFAVLRWPWRLAGVAAVAVVAATAQASGINKGTVLGLAAYLAVLAVNVLPMCSLTWLDRYNDQQKDRRELTLAEVSEAKSKLEATLAENAGLHQQLLTQAREAGILDERQRMAREIHDTLAQGLTGIVTQLQAAEHAADDPAGWRRHFAAATRLARESLTEARRSVDALRPEPLETARLSDALTSVAGRWSTLHGVPVQVTTTGTVRPLPPERRGCAAPHGAGGAGQRGQARPGGQGRADAVVHGPPGRPGRARRRPGLRPGGGQGLRPGRDAAADRGAVRDAAGRIRTRRRHGHFGIPPGRSRRTHRSRRSARSRPSARSTRKGTLMNPSDVAPIKLLIADDHPVVRDGLSSMFARDPEFEVLGEAADGAEAVRLAQALRPNVVLMDLRMPGMDGVTAITELARRGVAVRVLVLTTYDTDSHVLPAIEAGATGYLLKDAPRDELLRAVRAAAQGDAVLSPSVAARLMNRFRAPGAGPLSQRELEVLEMVAAGTTNREAAARLFISEATVKTHLLNIYAKLGVSDRAAAVAEAFNRGLLTPEAPER